MRIYLKREDLCHTGAHKINNCIGQVLLARRMGKTPHHRRDRRRPARRRDRHGVRAVRAALRGLHGRRRRRAPGAERLPHEAARRAGAPGASDGTATLKDAMNEALRDWVTNVRTTHYVIGSVAGPHPYPTLVRELQAVIGARGARADPGGGGPACPTRCVACVGGGSNAMGLFHAFVPDARRRALRRRGGGRRHRHRPARGDAGARAASACCTARGRTCCATTTGRSRRRTRSPPASTTPASARSTRYLKDTGRAHYLSVTDDGGARRASSCLARTEGILVRARERARDRGAAEGRAARCRRARSSSSTSRGAATRTWGPSPSASG